MFSDDLKVEEHILSATKYIYLSSSYINDRILTIILEKLREGVEVKIFFDSQSDFEVIFKLKKSGGKIYYVEEKQNFVFVDGKCIFREFQENSEKKKDSKEEITLNIGEIEKKAVHIQDIVGFALNPVGIEKFSFVLIEDLPKNSFVEVLWRGNFYICIIEDIKSYNNFFSDPFSDKDFMIFGGDKDWVKINSFSFVRGDIKIATARVFGVLSEGKFRESLLPFPPSTPVFISRNVPLKLNFSWEEMRKPVRIGFSNLGDVYVDFEVFSRHVMVSGTTGSGKTSFVKKLINEIKNFGVTVYIFDEFGEYFFEDAFITSIDDTIFPLAFSRDDIYEILYPFGLSDLVLGEKEEARNRRRILFSMFQPDILKTGLRTKSLLKIFKEHLFVSREDIEHIDDDKVFDNQPQIVERILNALSHEGIIVFDFSKVSDIVSKINIMGLILKRIFETRSEEGKMRVIVIEEAHKFCSLPEKRNIFLQYLRKISDVGRKLKIGLIIVTPRPNKLDKSVLSQINTYFLFRTLSKEDISTLSSVEYCDENILKNLTILPPGSAFVVGLSVPFPFLFRF